MTIKIPEIPKTYIDAAIKSDGMLVTVNVEAGVGNSCVVLFPPDQTYKWEFLEYVGPGILWRVVTNKHGIPILRSGQPIDQDREGLSEVSEDEIG